MLDKKPQAPCRSIATAALATAIALFPASAFAALSDRGEQEAPSAIEVKVMCAKSVDVPEPVDVKPIASPRNAQSADKPARKPSKTAASKSSSSEASSNEKEDATVPGNYSKPVAETRAASASGASPKTGDAATAIAIFALAASALTSGGVLATASTKRRKGDENAQYHHA